MERVVGSTQGGCGAGVRGGVLRKKKNMISGFWFLIFAAGKLYFRLTIDSFGVILRFLPLFGICISFQGESVLKLI